MDPIDEAFVRMLDAAVDQQAKRRLTLQRYNAYVLMKFEEHCRAADTDLRSAATHFVAFYRQLQSALADAVEWQKMVETIRKP